MSVYPNQPSLQTRFITVEISDISTAGQIFVFPGFQGKIKNIRSVLNGTIATADAVLTAKIDGVAVTDGAITVAFSGSVAGDTDTATPTALNFVTQNQAIEIETDGASTNAIAVVLTIEYEAV